MNASTYWGGFGFQTGGPSLLLRAGVRHVELDADGDEVALSLPDPQDLAPGGEHWRIFVRNGSLGFGQIIYQPAGIPVTIAPGVTFQIEPANALGIPLVDNATGLETIIEGQVRGEFTPYVVVDGVEFELEFGLGEFIEGGIVEDGGWLGVSFAGYRDGEPVWLYQIGQFEDAPAADQSAGMVLSHGSDGSGATANAWRFDAGLSTWRTLANAATNRTGAQAFPVGLVGLDSHVIAGGGGLSSVERYLLDTWGTATALPATTTGAASWDSLGAGFVHGGSATATLREYVAEGLGTWVTRASSPLTKSAHTGGRLSGASSGFAYVSGDGIGGAGGIVQRYQAGANVWSSAVPQRPSGTVSGVSSAPLQAEDATPARVWVGGLYEWQLTPVATDARQATDFRASPVECWRQLPDSPVGIQGAAGAGAGPIPRAYFGAGGSFPGSALVSLGTLDVWRTEPNVPAARNGTQNHGTAGRSQV